MRAIDAAYSVLKQRGEPLDVQDLLDETLAVLGFDRDARRVAKIYTDLNMDVRFQYRGGSLWGLKEWQPKGGGRGGTSGIRERTFTYDDDDAEEIEEDDG